MLRLTKKSVKFLLATFAISYICFFYLVVSVSSFGQILNSPVHMGVFCIGCLAPFISALLVSLKENPNFLKEIFTIKNTKMMYLVIALPVLHYTLAFFVGLVGTVGSVSQFLTALPVMIILLGLAEVGWRKILFEELLTKMGMWRSCICIGLFMGLCFAPLSYIPGFLITPNSFIPFSVYLVGIGILSATVYTQSGGVLASIIFMGLFTALSIVFPLSMGNGLIVMFFVDLVIGIAYTSKKLNKISTV